MPGVTIKDVNQQCFIRVLVALRSLGSCKSLNGWTPSHWPSIKRSLPTMRTGFYTHELLPQHGTCTMEVGLAHDQDLRVRGDRQIWYHAQPSCFSKSFRNMAHWVLQALEGLKMAKKDQDGGWKLTLQWQIGTKPLDKQHLPRRSIRTNDAGL